jgi:hypothetical protein
MSCGKSDEIFIENKRLNSGPPPSFNKIVKIIRKRVKKLKV